MQWAVRRVNLLFPLCTSSLIFYPPSVRPWETHLSTRCSTRFSSRLNLFLFVECDACTRVQIPSSCWGREPSPASPSALKSTHRNSGPFLASTLLLLLSSPPSPPPPLHSLQLANSLVSSIASLQAVESEYTEKFPPRREVEFYPAMPHCTTPLHCTVMQWTL